MSTYQAPFIESKSIIDNQGRKWPLGVSGQIGVSGQTRVSGPIGSIPDYPGVHLLFGIIGVIAFFLFIKVVRIGIFDSL